MQFCQKCDNKLRLREENGLTMYCDMCQITYPLKSHVIMEKNYNKEQSVEELLKQQTMNDDTMPIDDVECPKCKARYVHYFVTSDMKKVYVCRNCK